MGNAALWHIQQSPSDPSETWALYRSDAPFFDIFQAAVKEFGDPKDQVRYETCKPGEKGAIHQTVNGRDYFSAPTEARFTRRDTEIFISKSGARFQFEEFTKRLPKWPSSNTLIAIRRNSSGSDRVRGWITSLQWQGMSADTPQGLFTKSVNELPPEIAFFYRSAPLGMTHAAPDTAKYHAGQVLGSLQMGYLQTFMEHGTKELFDRWGVTEEKVFPFFKDYLYPRYKLGLAGGDKPVMVLSEGPDGNSATATTDFYFFGNKLPISVTVHKVTSEPGKARYLLDFDQLLINSWRILAAERDIKKPFPQNLVEAANLDRYWLQGDFGIMKFPGKEPGTWMTWKEKLSWLSQQTEASLAK